MKIGIPKFQIRVEYLALMDDVSFGNRQTPIRPLRTRVALTVGAVAVAPPPLFSLNHGLAEASLLQFIILLIPQE